MNSRAAVIWDWPVRAFHWLLVVGVLASWLSIEVFDDVTWHLRIGQALLGLVVFRLLWGLWGSPNARFHRFVPTPGRLLAYLRAPDAWRGSGHNPLGALSVVAMLGVISVQVVSGLLNDDEIFTTGPLAKYVSSDTVALAAWVHANAFDLLVALIALHLLAILFYRVVKKQDLVRPMITGRASPAVEPATAGHEAESASLRPVAPWLPWFTLAVSAGFSYWVFTL